MSFSQDPRRRRGPAGVAPSSRRTVLGYWVPLVLTVGIATASIAAWVWSERSDADDESEERREDERRDDDYPPAGGPPSGEYIRGTATDYRGPLQDDATMLSRMQGALRRTPSPQQILDGASRRVAAGVAAAGAFVGGALTSIREENRGDYEDHSRWSEEMTTRATDITPTAATAGGTLPGRGTAPAAPVTDKRKKTVAIVVSSESLRPDPDDFEIEHASIFSHLPENVDPDTSRIFVLIYAPGLKHAISQGTATHPTLSVTSSYSNIATEEATSPGDRPAGDLVTVEPQQLDEFEGSTPLFRTLYTQAQSLVEKETMIMPFSTPTGHVHLVRHISPDLVYIQESLTGKDGDAVHHIAAWVRQVIVVVGDDGGRGGLIDSEDESALADNGEKWWQKDGITGIGRRIDVVDVHMIGEDWRRRVRGLD